MVSAVSPQLSSVVARVTGGQLSFVDGLLRDHTGRGSLSLEDPRGAMFGPAAALDVPGAFHASTADYLRLADSGVFWANA
jgi:filamentous hemagglutinin family protein